MKVRARIFFFPLFICLKLYFCIVFHIIIVIFFLFKIKVLVLSKCMYTPVNGAVIFIII